MHAAVGDFILDCLQNSVEADASLIELTIEQVGNRLSVFLKDNGCGMDSHELEKAVDPFYTDGKKHEHRKVGLGLPFLIQAMDLAGGDFDLQSEKGRGTELKFGFDRTNFDAPPLGRLDNVFLSALMFSGDYELIIQRRISGSQGEDEYTLSRNELKEILGGLEDSSSLLLAREFLLSQEEELINLLN